MGQSISGEIERFERDKSAIEYNFGVTVDDLINEGDIQQIFSEEELLDYIFNYFTTHKSEILEFLGDNGKILIPMDSAEKFADIVTEILGIDIDRIVKFKVSTYKNGVSANKLLSEDDKVRLSDEIDIKKGERVLIVEDLIDTGHTLKMLDDFLSNSMVKIQALCLLDKHVESSELVRKQFGERLKSIIDIGEEFVIGFGMDYDYRLAADMPGLWKIKTGSIKKVTNLLNTYTKRMQNILEKKEKGLERALQS